MPLDIDGAGRSRSLACLPTARGTVAPREASYPRGLQNPTSLQAGGSKGLEGLQGFQGPGLYSPPGASKGLQGRLEGSRTVQDLRPPQASRSLQKPPGPAASKPRKPLQNLSRTFTSSLHQGPRLRLQAVCPEGSRALLHSGPSAYTNEKVLLLTKMDLTEFRS